MDVYRVDPLRDPRWVEFLKTHPDSSAFHTPAWLGALGDTYGYEPAVLTTAEPGQPLRSAIAVCHVHSRLTGRRIVSLPFSDHCQPLVESNEALDAILLFLQEMVEREDLRYLELRPLQGAGISPAGFGGSQSFFLHRLDLRPGLETIFAGFHGSSVQRKIRRAEREGLAYEEGCSTSLLQVFYDLHRQTRRRHQLPPQPITWFHNLIAGFGDRLKIRVALKGKTPIAAILTLAWKDVMVYKYGGWDSSVANLGGTHLLFWKTIQEAKSASFRELDLGRSDPDDGGLITFKERWGATRSELKYLRFPATAQERTRPGWKTNLGKWAFAHMPDAFLTLAGKLLYRHMG